MITLLELLILSYYPQFLKKLGGEVLHFYLCSHVGPEPYLQPIVQDIGFAAEFLPLSS